MNVSGSRRWNKVKSVTSGSDNLISLRSVYWRGNPGLLPGLDFKKYILFPGSEPWKLPILPFTLPHGDAAYPPQLCGSVPRWLRLKCSCRIGKVAGYDNMHYGSIMASCAEAGEMRLERSKWDHKRAIWGKDGSHFQWIEYKPLLGPLTIKNAWKKTLLNILVILFCQDCECTTHTDNVLHFWDVYHLALGCQQFSLQLFPMKEEVLLISFKSLFRGSDPVARIKPCIHITSMFLNLKYVACQHF